MTATPTSRSRFARLAREPGGLARDQAIARAETQLAELAAEYPAWMAVNLAAVEAAVGRADTSAGQPSDALHEVYRSSTALRDLGASIGYPLATVVADKLCELVHRLDRARHYSPGAVHTHLDALRLVCGPDYAGRAPADAATLLDGLSAVVAKYPAMPEKPGA